MASLLAWRQSTRQVRRRRTANPQARDRPTRNPRGIHPPEGRPPARCSSARRADTGAASSARWRGPRWRSSPLAAHPVHQGWAAPLGARDVASAIGTTRDTAGRAVAALGAAGLVSLDRVTDPDGRRRSGYRLRSPGEIARHSCPSIPDDVHRPKDQDAGSPVVAADRCPKIQDSQARPAQKDGSNEQRPEERSTNQPRSATRRASDSQPRLFDPPVSSGEAVP